MNRGKEDILILSGKEKVCVVKDYREKTDRERKSKLESDYKITNFGMRTSICSLFWKIILIEKLKY